MLSFEGKKHTTCPKDFVENRNISNILEEAPPLLNKLMFIVIGARDFSPEITVHLIGTKVPCFDKVPPPQIPIYRAEGRLLQKYC